MQPASLVSDHFGRRQVPGVTSAGRPVTTVFEKDYAFDAWTSLGTLPTLILADDQVLHHPITTDALAVLGRGDHVLMETVQAGEQAKQSGRYESLLQRLGGFRPEHLILIGGGTLINLGLFLAAEPRLEAAKQRPSLCSIVPTNTMAIADVALGGLGMLNGTDGRKNVLRRERDPDWIWLFPEFVVGAPVELRRDGIAEVLKHALLQRTALIEPIARLYLAAQPDGLACYQAAVEGLWLKAECLACMESAGTEDIEFILSYGHLHAHVIEEIWQGTVSHSECVFIGLLVDLTLSGYLTLVEHLSKMIMTSPMLHRIRRLLAAARVEAYLHAYPTTGRFVADPNSYWVADISSKTVGAVLTSGALRLGRLRRSAQEIRSAYDELGRRFA